MDKRARYDERTKCSKSIISACLRWPSVSTLDQNLRSFHRHICVPKEPVSIFDSLSVLELNRKCQFFALRFPSTVSKLVRHMTTRNDRLKCSYLFTVLAVRERRKYKRVKMVTCRLFMFDCHYSYDVSTWCGTSGITWT